MLNLWWTLCILPFYVVMYFSAEKEVGLSIYTTVVVGDDVVVFVYIYN